MVVASATPTEDGTESGAALAEALSHLPGVSFVVGERPGGEAIAVVAHDRDGRDDRDGEGDGGDADGGADGTDRGTVRAALGKVWPLIHACRPTGALYAGVSEPVTTPAALAAAVGQARYALAAAARTAAPRTVDRKSVV